MNKTCWYFKNKKKIVWRSFHCQAWEIPERLVGVLGMVENRRVYGSIFDLLYLKFWIWKVKISFLVWNFELDELKSDPWICPFSSLVLLGRLNCPLPFCTALVQCTSWVANASETRALVLAVSINFEHYNGWKTWIGPFEFHKNQFFNKIKNEIENKNKIFSIKDKWKKIIVIWIIGVEKEITLVPFLFVGSWIEVEDHCGILLMIQMLTDL